MREIKFRAWDSRSTKMIHFDLQDYSIDRDSEYGSYDIPSDGESYDQPKYLMQYTGLKDKNDTGIYEGDLIKVSFYSFVPNTLHIVKWSDKDARFYGEMVEVDPHFSFYQDREYSFHESTICEVVGNIYENPNLLPSKETVKD